LVLVQQTLDSPAGRAAEAAREGGAGVYVLNKIVWLLFNPLTVSLAAIAAGCVLAAFARRALLRRAGAAVAVLSAGLLWFVSTPACFWLLGAPLERPYLATQTVDSLPSADAIVLLGGGISKTGALAYPDLSVGADRAWHAARLYKAGKAPRIVVSGRNDRAAVVPFLLDLGVPPEAIAVDDASRNTYENARFTERLLCAETNAAPVSVLLVTSAWHMARARGHFAKTSLAVVPAAADFTVHSLRAEVRGGFDWVLPSAGALQAGVFLAKEWVGRLARR
jgi:uncharacterized SAM-binding protein YcdF (DUF218 family)